MSSRRAFLKLLGGTAAAAPLVTPRQAAAALGLDPSKVGIAGGGAGMAAHEAAPKAPRLLVSDIYRDRERKSRPVKYMPPHIRNKKSWSDEFKASCFRDEDRVMDAFIKKIEEDDTFAERVTEMLLGRK